MFRLLFSCLLILHLSTSISFAQWKSIGPFSNPGNGIGSIQKIQSFNSASDEVNTILFASSSTAGLWKSVNSGKKWSNKDTNTDFLNIPGIADFAIHPQNPKIIYMVQGSNMPAHYNVGLKVFKSVDGGENWIESASGFILNKDSSQFISKIMIHPDSPDILYVSTSEGIFKSNNAAKSWKRILKGSISDMLFMPNNYSVLYAAGTFPDFSNNFVLLKSTDHGLKWEKMADMNTFSCTKITNIKLSVCTAKGYESFLYALLANNEKSRINNVFVSRNSGFQWKHIDIPETIVNTDKICIEVSPLKPDEIYIAYDKLLFKSTNDSINKLKWEKISETCYGKNFVNDIQFTALGNEVFVCSDAGVFNLTSCTDLNNGLVISNIEKIEDNARNPSVILAGSKDVGTLFYESYLTKKRKWNYIGLNQSVEQLINRNDKYSMISASPNLGLNTKESEILCTKDNWKTKFTLPNPSEQGAKAALYDAPIIQDYDEINTYYFGYNHLYKAQIDFTKETVLWSQKSRFPSRFGLNESYLISSIALSPQDHNLIFVAYMGGRIFKSSVGGDGGSSTQNCITACWTDITPLKNLKPEIVVLLAVHPLNPKRIMLAYSGYDKMINATNRILLSVDGATFLPYAQGLPNVSVNKLLFLNDMNATALIATDAGVFYRNNKMSEWKSYSDKLPNVSIKDIEFNEALNVVRVATMGRGVWEAPAPFTGKSDELVIDLDQTWNYGKRVDGNILILKGRVLTIKSKVSIANHTKIILQSNAKLIMENSGEITNNENGNDAWNGEIAIEENASLICNKGSSIRMKGNGGISFKVFKNPSQFVIQEGAEILLNDEQTYIKFKGGSPSENSIRNFIKGKGKII